MKHKDIFLKLAAISVEAGAGIMSIYSADFGVEMKEDNSPLTEADKISNKIITEALAGLRFNGALLPVVSEENEIPGFERRKDWEYFWLVDPLDGTKEFVSRNGEFTVNIALIRNGSPYLGMVYQPVNGLLYFGGKDIGSFKTVGDDTGLESCMPLPAGVSRDPEILVAAGSRSHRSIEFDSWVEAEAARRGCRSVEIVTAGSSLKFCLAAEGLIDVYPRFGPTMEWDTAAAHAVVEGAGKKCCTTDGGIMMYNKAVMRNEAFIVA